MIVFTVQEFLSRIEAGEDRGSIYKSIGVHRSTIPGVMRRLGYQLDKKSGCYTWSGSGEEPITYNLLSGGNRATSDSPMPAIEKDIAMPAKDNTMLVKDSTMLANQQKTSKIVFIRDDKQDKEKLYRGYYLESELSEIMDSIKNKSEVVNDALREYFRNQGIL